MKSKLTTISLHIVGWCLLLLMPCITTYQHIKYFAPNTNRISFLPTILVSIINIIIFYINYFYLIPRFLFTKKYLNYSFLFLSCLVLSIALDFLIFRITGSDWESLEVTNPVLTLVRHTDTANAFQLLVVSCVTSL